jgi:hypothetical protein
MVDIPQIALLDIEPVKLGVAGTNFDRGGIFTHEGVKGKGS